MNDEFPTGKNVRRAHCLARIVSDEWAGAMTEEPAILRRTQVVGICVGMHQRCEEWFGRIEDREKKNEGRCGRGRSSEKVVLDGRPQDELTD
ncbi:hypothetical protein PPTG_21613 [Phytophthora nicotianae INRA-310]|uniref:Uncharacterized protein n=1 Tax=Phytophthora nicotianae (strain INRA-310) TaxID=761204 RepID=W2R0K1_PHYN3|nr:hypothetical protein PPTG_21613 [Phytophthora nicotianae INRA-310]ETN18863.1 hypothetical protein PPTG_21613 [Phytophthora nicotianae INRA-310]